jgi:ribonuclease T2
MRALLLSTLLLSAIASPASAQVAMQGTFDATQNCPAFQSFRKGTNPGNVVIQAGQGYKLLGKNRDAATHYWLEVPGASPLQRWVAADCGTANGTVAEGGNGPAPGSGQPEPSGTPFFILAVSWQPAFCEGKWDKTECENQTAERYDATHFTLHGLWPQPRDNNYCGVSQDEFQASDSKRWEDLPDLRPQLQDATEAALDKVMPGTQSFLERHEWTKHGSCYTPRDPEVYFKDSVRLMDELNASAAQKLVANNIGQTVTSSVFRAAIDETFGAGAGDRMRLTCKQDGGRRLLVEITIGLKGDVAAGTALKDLIAAASPTDPGCPSFMVDPVGLQ